MKRVALNYLISVLVLLGLNAMGWIHIHPSLLHGLDIVTQQLIIAAVISLIYGVLKFMADGLFSLFVLASQGLGCLLMPAYGLVIGLVVLYIIAHIVPTYLSLTTDPILALLAGVALGILQIPRITIIRRDPPPSQGYQPDTWEQQPPYQQWGQQQRYLPNPWEQQPPYQQWGQQGDVPPDQRYW